MRKARFMLRYQLVSSVFFAQITSDQIAWFQGGKCLESKLSCTVHIQIHVFKESTVQRSLEFHSAAWQTFQKSLALKFMPGYDRRQILA